MDQINQTRNRLLFQLQKAKETVKAIEAQLTYLEKVSQRPIKNGPAPSPVLITEEETKQQQ